MAEARTTALEDVQSLYGQYRNWVNPEGNNILRDMAEASRPNADPAAMERVVNNIGGAGSIKNAGVKIVRRAGESLLSWYRRLQKAAKASKAEYSAAGAQRTNLAEQVAKENARVAGGGGGTVPLTHQIPRANGIGTKSQFMSGGQQGMRDAQTAAAKDARFRTGEKVAGAGGLGVGIVAGSTRDGFYTPEEQQARVFEGNKGRLQVDNERIARGERSALAPDKRASIEAAIAKAEMEAEMRAGPGDIVPQYGPDDPEGHYDPANMVEPQMVLPVGTAIGNPGNVNVRAGAGDYPGSDTPAPDIPAPGKKSDPIVAARDLAQGQQKAAIMQQMRNAYYGQGPYYEDTLNPTDNFRAGLDAFGQAPRPFRRR